MRELLLPVMKNQSVDYYVTGHDHNMQHWVEKDNPHGGLEHVISGAGGKSRYSNSILSLYQPILYHLTIFI